MLYDYYDSYGFKTNDKFVTYSKLQGLKYGPHSVINPKINEADSFFEENFQGQSVLSWPLTNKHVDDDNGGNNDFYRKQYLTFEVLEDGTFSFSRNALQYSVDGGETWETLAANTATPTITAGSKILWKQTGLTPNSSYGIGTFSATSNFKVSGNIMSLYYGDDFVGQTDLTGKDYAFTKLFTNNKKLVSTTNLILPTTTLATGCYWAMFKGCTSLTTAPNVLPATTLAEGCYGGMFQGCTSLTSTPELPATTLAEYCYESMFNGCTSLTTAPELPATTLTPGCYEFMFKGCTSLNYIKCLATDISAEECTINWLNNVAENGMFIKADGMEDWEYGDSGIPYGWFNGVTKIIPTIQINTQNYLTVSLDSDEDARIAVMQLPTNQTLYISEDHVNWMEVGPVSLFDIPKTNLYLCGKLSDNNTPNETTFFSTFGGPISITGNCNSLWDYENIDAPLKEFCGYRLFYNCQTLTTAPELPATTLAEGCYAGMFQGCTSLTTAPNVLPATTLAEYCYEEMFQGCTSLTTAPELPATTLVEYCYAGMFQGCTSLTSTPELPATTLAEYCYESMFNGCTSLTSTPELPATTLADWCYNGMFGDCSSLTKAPELPATTLAEGCYGGMFQGCTSLTSTPELPATTLANYCYNQMFQGCTSLVNAPSLLSATTLAERCYYGMFKGCTSLTQAPETLPATTLAQSCYWAMFQGCTSLTTAPELPATTLANYCYMYMFEGCTSLNYIKCLATDTSADSCTQSWVSGVASSGTFVKDASMASWRSGASGIPSNWTIENATIGSDE